ncbi:hypothetical protein K431DRAFT_281396 [Polychaeton citri CBS 116435]|uniref:NADH-ubiquinone oxidoreductase 17.8 kDa subunit n=1 Tax=Polychaeton citri CBS 116435 TaxID=1314669 RepID=A0A9P4QHE1_9PEZI|nr:hypothetical protein K431DRAFT_281396 [Polychaeton citri CBS 116435]
MQSLSKAAVRSARSMRRAGYKSPHQQPRRPASDSHHHSEPVNESFGRGFYIAIASVPITLALFKLSNSTTVEGSAVTRYIFDKYAELGKTFQERNDIHTQFIEQAAADRTLFLNESNRNQRIVQHRFPEMINAGSPLNVPAGQGSADLSAMIEKYEQENRELEAEKLAQLRENRVPREQPVHVLTKRTPSTESA